MKAEETRETKILQYFLISSLFVSCKTIDKETYLKFCNWKWIGKKQILSLELDFVYVSTESYFVSITISRT